MPQETVVKTGFRKFDRLTGGIGSSDLICLLSWPSQGKTALALGIAANVSLARKRKPRPVLLFSLKLPREQVALRLLSARLQVPLRELRNGFLPRNRWTDITEATDAISEAPFYINNDSKGNLERICLVSRQLASELQSKGERLGLIAIDHWRFIGGKKGGLPSPLESAARLKGLARELHAPILLTAQVDRRPQEKLDDDSRPRLEDKIEGPGAPSAEELARVADLLAFVHCGRESWRGGNGDAGAAEIILAKNARGRTGTVPLRFIREIAWFKN